MTRFRYLAFDADGRREQGHIEVSTSDQAWDRLVGLGLRVVELEPDATERKRPGWVTIRKRPIPATEQADLAEQLAVLLGAKLPLTEALRIAAMTVPASASARILLRLRQLVEDGQSLHEAFAAGPGLSPLFTSVARMGEAGNSFPEMFRALASTLRRQDKLTAQIGAALVYPFILVVGGIVVFLLMTMFLAPRLSTIFTFANRPLPTELAFFTGLGQFLSSWGHLVAIAVALIGITSLLFVRQRRQTVLDWLSAVPLIGVVLREASLARLSAATGLLLQAGVPLVSSLREVSNAFEKDLFARLFSKAADAVEEGGSATSVFREDLRLSPLFRELFAVGESTNRLPEVLSAATQRLEAQTERRIQQLLALLTPVLTLVIGGGIAFLVYSVMGALMSVNELAL